MTIISLPIWILAAAIGTPSLCLLWLVLSLIRRKRSARRTLSRRTNDLQQFEQRLHADQFHQSLSSLQIDAVFNGLVALIETERIKLKAMMGVNPSLAAFAETPSCSVSSGDANPSPARAEESDDAIDDAIDQQIVQYAAEGQNPAAIASHLGLSLAEVDLAMKMRAAKASKPGRKLEAVA